MAGNLPRRILNETRSLLSDPTPGISAVPDEKNARYFHAMIAGPKDSPFESGIFKLELFLAEGFPMEPPKVRFLTKIFHPNIDQHGRVSLDILEDKWSPVLGIRLILLSIQALLSAPNADDPLEADVGETWRMNASKAHRIAREWTHLYADGNRPWRMDVLLDDLNESLQAVDLESPVCTDEATTDHDDDEEDDSPRDNGSPYVDDAEDDALWDGQSFITESAAQAHASRALEARDAEDIDGEQ